MSKLIFVSSPYNHSDPLIVEENYIKVSKFVAELTSQGHVVISPITYGHTILQFKELRSDWEYWRNFCVTFLRKCDELIVYKMDGWDKSKGVLNEIGLANELGIEVKYVEYEPIR